MDEFEFITDINLRSKFTSILTRPCDITISSVEFHSYVIALYSDSYIKFPNILEDIKCSEDTLEEFKNIIYLKKDKISGLSDEEVFDLYIIFDYLVIPDFDHLFLEVKSIKLTIHCLNKYGKNDITTVMLDNIQNIDEYKEEYKILFYYNPECFTDDIINDIVETYKESSDHMLIHGIAFVLFKRDSLNEKITAYKMFKNNYDNNKNIISLYQIALMHKDGIGCEKDEKKYVDIINHINSTYPIYPAIYQKAICMTRGDDFGENKEEGLKLFKLNWDEHRHIYSLYNYAIMVNNGVGCCSDTKKSLNILKFIFTKYKYTEAFDSYAKILENRTDQVCYKQLEEQRNKYTVRKFIK
jgi:hypothetical protein